HPRAVDENLDERAGQRQLVNFAAVEFEGIIGPALLIAPMLKEIGPERVENEIEEAAQDAVFIEAGHRIKQRPYPLNDDGRRFVAILPGCRIEADVEKLDDTANDFGVAAENIHHIGLAV